MRSRSPRTLLRPTWPTTARAPVTPIDLGHGTPGTPISVGANPDAIAITPNGSTAYVANYGSGTVTPIDLRSGTPGYANHGGD